MDQGNPHLSASGPYDAFEGGLEPRKIGPGGL